MGTITIGSWRRRVRGGLIGELDELGVTVRLDLKNGLKEIV
jgi:hypothetical protein